MDGEKGRERKEDYSGANGLRGSANVWRKETEGEGRRKLLGLRIQKVGTFVGEFAEDCQPLSFVNYLVTSILL